MDKEVSMNCIHCHGQMKLSKAPFHVDHKGHHLVFDTVPACLGRVTIKGLAVRRTLRSAKSVPFRVPLRGSTNRLSGLFRALETTQSGVVAKIKFLIEERWNEHFNR